MQALMQAHAGWLFPTPVMIHLWWMLGWALIFGAVVRRITHRAWWGAVAFALLCIPGEYAPLGYWALVVQSPSVVLVVWAMLSGRAQTQTHDVPTPVLIGLSALGWLLALEAFQVWPTGWPSLFAWGFEPSALWALLVLIVALVWAYPAGAWRWQAFAVMGVYVGLRVPTGNVWDAIMDPWVWLGAQWLLWGRVTKYSRQNITRSGLRNLRKVTSPGP